ncbi:MAG: HAD-IA family hydrolase [Patescibacteria group bacterium]
MIKAIIFDFAGVIGSDGYWIYLKDKLIDLEERKSYFHELSVKVDDATITHQEFVQIIATELKVPEEIVWKEIFKRIVINQELLEIINKLKKRYKICLLTNFVNEWMKELFKVYKLDKYFDVKVVSSLEKMVKPNKEIYLLALNLLKLKPNETIFIDDRQYNVDGGEKVGIKSLLFTTNEKLKKDFKNLGIKT